MLNMKKARFIKYVACLLLIYSVACSTQEQNQESGLVIDNQDPEMELTGPWTLLEAATAYNGDCAWAPHWENSLDGLIDPSVAATATVRPTLPQAGMYEIYAWWCDPGIQDLSTKQLLWLCTSQGYGCSWVYINPQAKSGQWNSLGTFYLDEDGDITVRNSERGLGAPPGFETISNGAVIIDAFRFVHRATEMSPSTSPSLQPQPSPTP
jgi:hypothetical protein